MTRNIGPLLFLSLLFLLNTVRGQEVGEQLPPWQEGMLDIHHINTGRGDAAYFIFPDGTTLLVDAGDMNPFGERIGTPRNSRIHPDSSKSAPLWIVEYIRQFAPANSAPVLDYAMITHFHDDHYGSLHQKSEPSHEGDYKLTGITEVGEYIPIRMLLDRGYPDYAYPVPLKGEGVRQMMAFNPPFKQWYETFDNYQKFIEYQRKEAGMQAAQLKAGSNTQIALKYLADKYPEFEVRNIKSNGSIWTGKGDETYEYFPDFSDTPVQERPGENPLSNALRISYGPFDYFTGGDMPGIADLGEPEWKDVETPVAKAVGPVDVVAFNHHGNRDCCNPTFISTLRPRVWIEQTWSSDHPGHEVLRRVTSRHLYPGERDLFATNILEANKQVIGPSLERAYQSTEGHIVIRVAAGGQTYQVITLNDNNAEREVTGVFGPYQAESKASPSNE
ncbi:hypothetical protein WJR50_08060 [Catalinimonas sp. 4WD22]|uniref:ComEC/Rec2 family competence protein n=1 Tax=Catalinimonas locisalis TaxID=3133978 RepID=UPI00310163E9